MNSLEELNRFVREAKGPAGYIMHSDTLREMGRVSYQQGIPLSIPVATNDNLEKGIVQVFYDYDLFRYEVARLAGEEVPDYVKTRLAARATGRLMEKMRDEKFYEPEPFGSLSITGPYGRYGIPI